MLLESLQHPYRLSDAVVFIYSCELVYPHYSGITSETEIMVLALEVGNIKTNLHWKKISYLSHSYNILQFV